MAAAEEPLGHRDPNRDWENHGKGGISSARDPNIAPVPRRLYVPRPSAVVSFALLCSAYCQGIHWLSVCVSAAALCVPPLTALQGCLPGYTGSLSVSRVCLGSPLCSQWHGHNSVYGRDCAPGEIVLYCNMPLAGMRQMFRGCCALPNTL